MMLKNKNAQIGATLTWFTAFVIIFFIMLVFIFFCIVIAGEKKIESISSLDALKNEKTSNSFVISDINRPLMVLLNSPVQDGRTFYEFLSTVNLQEGKKEDIIIFEDKTKRFLDENLGVGEDRIYYRSWIRLYPVNEEISQYADGKFDVALTSRGGSGGIDCDPLEKGAVSIIIQIIPDKKIAVCGNI